ncbi:hypothetical protein GF412_04255 [Candidatus Micrarchaeota archaeon]|nr:hypothetical protein [Candidatus Micrarchaeota archaeon]MBD3418163.1 hypothetical protein [Candidatus Micrarchaeota archaeon]
MQYKGASIFFLFVLLGTPLALPSAGFISPTPPDGTITTNTSFILNTSIEEQNLHNLTYDWNGANYTIYGNSLKLALNLDNVAALGDNSTYSADISGHGNNGTFYGLESTGYSKINTTSATKTASGTYSTYYPDFAFDRNLSTWWWSPNAATGHWLMVDFGAGSEKTVTKIRLYHDDAVSIGAVLQASDDNSTWANLTFFTHDGELTWFNETFSNTEDYRYYRILVLNGTPSINWLRVEEWELYEGGEGTLYGPGKYREGVDLDGSNDYIDCGNGESLQITGDVTVAAWIKPATGGDGSHWKPFISKLVHTSSKEGYELWLGTDNSVRFSVGSSWSNWDYATSSNTLSADTWYHVVGIYDGSTIKVYVDGVEKGSTNFGGGIVDSGTPLLIGKRQSGGTPFDGTVDEPRVWSRAFSGEEVYEHYTSNINRHNSTQWYFFANQSKNATTGLPDGAYSYEVFAEDSSSNLDSTGEQEILIGELNPSVNLMLPAEGASFSYGETVEFSFNQTNSHSTSMSCSLYINGSLNRTNTSVLHSTHTSFSVPGILTGPYNWGINCSKSWSSAVSETRNFTVEDNEFPSIEFSTGCEPEGAYLERRYAHMNASASDSLGIENITAYLYSQDGTLNSTAFTDSSEHLFANFTKLGTGKYYVNATVYDTNGNSNSTGTRNFTINVNLGPGACYDDMETDILQLQDAEEDYHDAHGAYTCNSSELVGFPAITSTGEWICDYASSSEYNWSYVKGDSNASATSYDYHIDAPACGGGGYSAGCAGLSEQLDILKDAEEYYFMDYGTYGCGLSSYWSVPSGWTCNSASASDYSWTYTSPFSEEYAFNKAKDMDCTGNAAASASGFDGSTTDVSKIINTSSFSGLTVEIAGNGKIYWAGPIDIAGITISDFVSINSNYIEVITSPLPNFDLPATVSLYNLPYNSRPIIYRNGAECLGAACLFVSYSGGTYEFGVTGFSNYTAGPNAQLGIWDDNDPEGGNKKKQPGDNVFFFANYTNVTSGNPITGATCNIYFAEAPSGPFAMQYNGSSGLYYYNRTFSSATLNWNVTCNEAAYEMLNLTDTFYSFDSAIVELENANVTFISSSRYDGPNFPAGSASIEGGNISASNLTTNISTDRWAGFYGNATARIVLAEYNASIFMHEWHWTAADGGLVCASTNSSLGLVNATGARGADIDTAWSFAVYASDSGAKTFNLPNCSLRFGPTILDGADYADTGYSGGFETCAYKTAFTPAKEDMFFCVDVIDSGPLFNGGNADFELMVPTEFGDAAYEDYYFYMLLN